jgi:hypothetical protein
MLDDAMNPTPSTDEELEEGLDEEALGEEEAKDDGDESDEDNSEDAE